MSESHVFDPSHLCDRLARVGRRLAEREAREAQGLPEARRRAEALHALVTSGLAAFHEAVRGAGAPQISVELSSPRLDDKHIRSVQFEVRRGRHLGIVTVKSRGEVTLVGPFRTGRNEGPCLSFPFGAETELEKALADFLERFLEEAATP
jgi:hypothetical protein